MAYCGICGSDITEYLNGPIFPPAEGQVNPHTGVSLPIVMGHEFAGTITEVGSEVKSLKVGQMVACSPACDHRHYGPPSCSPCQEERYNICDASTTHGLSARGGGFSDEIVVNALNCFVLPPGVSLKAAALVEPLAVAHHCIMLSGFQKGQKVLVCGAGPIGLAILVILRILGASQIIVTEVLATRMAQAKKIGADVVINPLKNSGDDSTASGALSAIMHETGGGVDIAFDATGVQSTLDLAIASVKPAGTILNVAIHKQPLSLNLNALGMKEKTLKAGICYLPSDFTAVLDILRDGSFDAESLITAVVPLSKVVEGGFQELINNRDAHIKILIQPDTK